jgi:hypothetical protein
MAIAFFKDNQVITTQMKIAGPQLLWLPWTFGTHVNPHRVKCRLSISILDRIEWDDHYCPASLD